MRGAISWPPLLRSATFPPENPRISKSEKRPPPPPICICVSIVACSSASWPHRSHPALFVKEGWFADLEARNPAGGCWTASLHLRVWCGPHSDCWCQYLAQGDAIWWNVVWRAGLSASFLLPPGASGPAFTANPKSNRPGSLRIRTSGGRFCMDTRCVDISVEPTREYVCAGLPAPQGATRSVSTHHSSLRASCLGELARFLSVELFIGSAVWDMCYVRDAGRRKKYRETLSEAQPCAER